MINKIIITTILVLGNISAQDHSIEGRWIQMDSAIQCMSFRLAFADAGLRYTYYCPENSCDNYWNIGYQ